MLPADGARRDLDRAVASADDDFVSGDEGPALERRTGARFDGEHWCEHAARTQGIRTLAEGGVIGAAREELVESCQGVAPLAASDHQIDVLRAFFAGA